MKKIFSIPVIFLLFISTSILAQQMAPKAIDFNEFMREQQEGVLELQNSMKKQIKIAHKKGYLASSYEVSLTDKGKQKANSIFQELYGLPLFPDRSDYSIDEVDVIQAGFKIRLREDIWTWTTWGPLVALAGVICSVRELTLFTLTDKVRPIRIVGGGVITLLGFMLWSKDAKGGEPAILVNARMDSKMVKDEPVYFLSLKPERAAMLDVEAMERVLMLLLGLETLNN